MQALKKGHHISHSSTFLTEKKNKTVEWKWWFLSHNSSFLWWYNLLWLWKNAIFLPTISNHLHRHHLLTPLLWVSAITFLASCLYDKSNYNSEYGGKMILWKVCIHLEDYMMSQSEDYYLNNRFLYKNITFFDNIIFPQWINSLTFFLCKQYLWRVK
jgi:hypothetical protein